MLIQVQLNGQLPLLSSITVRLQNIHTCQFWTIEAASWAQSCGKKGLCSGILHCDLLTARVAMSASIHEPICGSNHHPSTPKRADWKLIKNASARWMTGSFCWSSALKEEAGRSRVPGAASPRWPQPLSRCQALALSAAAYQWSRCLVCANVNYNIQIFVY